MLLSVDSKTVVVFDLDDTLYKEVDFVRSAFRRISETVFPLTKIDVFDEMWVDYLQGKEALGLLKNRHSLPVEICDLVRQYRYHKPNIALSCGAEKLLRQLSVSGAKLGVITDGRDETQNNKLHALAIYELFHMIVISESFGTEKPAEENYVAFESRFANCRYVYVGDNFHKDFVTPNRLGWNTIGLLDDGRNIHSQQGEFSRHQYPKYVVKSLSDIGIIVSGS